MLDKSLAKMRILDMTDLIIIYLKYHLNLTHTTIAKQINLTPPAIINRVNRYSEFTEAELIRLAPLAHEAQQELLSLLL